MANPDPHAARAAKRRKAVRKAGSPDDLRAVVWEAVSAASAIVRDPDTAPELRLRAVHAITQAAGAYAKVYEATEFHARLRAIEEAREKEHQL